MIFFTFFMTTKQKKFIEEYLLDLNATQAAIRTGYSAKTAYSQGQRLLKNVEVAQEIKARKEALSQRISADSEWFLKMLVKIASCETAPESVRTSDVLKALELIGKHLGFFEKEKLNMTDEELIEKARQYFDPNYRKEDNVNQIKRLN